MSGLIQTGGVGPQAVYQLLESVVLQVAGLNADEYQGGDLVELTFGGNGNGEILSLLSAAREAIDAGDEERASKTLEQLLTHLPEDVLMVGEDTETRAALFADPAVARARLKEALMEGETTTNEVLSADETVEVEDGDEWSVRRVSRRSWQKKITTTNPFEDGRSKLLKKFIQNIIILLPPAPAGQFMKLVQLKKTLE